jgi:hypothetical protein
MLVNWELPDRNNYEERAKRLKTRARWKFVRRSDRVVGVQILTSQTIGPFTWGRWERTPIGEPQKWRDHVFEPAQFLANPESFGISALGQGRRPDVEWRWLQIRSTVTAGGGYGAHLFDEYIDLSQDSANRDIVALICEQEIVPVEWVNEGLEIPWGMTAFHKSDGWRTTWREVLNNTDGVSAKDYHEEIEELKWHASPSYRPGIPRPRPYKRRSAKRPEDVIVPSFARRTGQIPKNGTPEMSGITLPKGARQPVKGAAYWASDGPVSELESLMFGLASIFPDTGLWPVAWSFPEAPVDYMGGGHHDIDAIDEINVQDLLTERWTRYRAEIDGASAETEFPGLAAAQPPGDNQTPGSLTSTLTEPAYLLLVPCSRPADAITALGGVGAVTPPSTISAVLRSWEERFGAVLCEAAPEVTKLTVTRPPQHHDQALALAAELHALDPHISEAVGDLKNTATRLLHQQAPLKPERPFTRTAWNIVWPKDIW